MLYSKFYSGLHKENIEESMIRDGFAPLLVSDIPNFEYKSHQHPETKIIAILEGNMIVKIGEEVFDCREGDKVIVPGNIIHSAVTGGEGCTFLWAQKIIRQEE